MFSSKGREFVVQERRFDDISQPADPPQPKQTLWARPRRAVQTLRVVFTQGLIGLQEYLTRSCYDNVREFNGSVSADALLDFSWPVKGFILYNDNNSSVDLRVDFDGGRPSGNTFAFSVHPGETRQIMIPTDKLGLASSWIDFDSLQD